MAPQIEYSGREERLQFVLERFHCEAPSGGRWGSCTLPDGISAIAFFADYIDGKYEFATIASKIWQ